MAGSDAATGTCLETVGTETVVGPEPECLTLHEHVNRTKVNGISVRRGEGSRVLSIDLRF